VIRRWLALLPVVTLCAACSSAVGGAPIPDSNEPRLPPRPRELNIEGIDPCGTLNSGQIKSLGVSRYSASPPDGKRGPSCDWDHYASEPIEHYSVGINTRGGVELVFGQPQLEVTTVAGFGAVQTPALYGTGKQDCVVNVDVAPSQAVQVAYFYNGTTVPMTHEIACQKARRAAELAMQTILARTG
jgi:Protein of unknown function (DUF3558)